MAGEFVDAPAPTFVDAPAPKATMSHVTTPFADPKKKPMFDTRGFENAMDDAQSQLGEVGKHVGGTVLDLLGRPGQAAVAGIARGPQAAGNAFIHGGAPTQDRDMATVRQKIGLAGVYDQKTKPDPVSQFLGQAGRGMIDAGLQLGLDPTTYLGGSGLIEKGANALGRQAYVAAAKGMAKANPVSRAAATIHDFVTPGGAASGAAKRTITAQQGEAGLDKYLMKKADVNAAKNAPEAAAAPEVAGPATINTNPHAISPNKQSRLIPQVGFGKPHIKAADAARAVAQAKKNADDALLANVGRPSAPILGGGLADVADLGKKATKGTTSLMFATPQLPGMEGHGSNILQTALMSDPGAALGGTARYLASGEPIPGAALRGAYQKLPGVRGLVGAQDAAAARAKAAGALTETPEKDPGFLDKIPLVNKLADYSSRTLWGYDDAIKGALNDAHTKNYLASGLDPKVARARAVDRVGQDVVDYDDKSDLTKLLSYGLPFATYATKKPGIVARAVARHPERVLALTRNNPNFSPDRDEAMSYPDQGRPLASIYNMLNNKSPGAKAQGPFPGAQYVRASAGAPVADLLGLANPYFTYGPPGKHADGDTAKGILKLLLSQTLGNVTGGDKLLNATGMNYFGDQ